MHQSEPPGEAEAITKAAQGGSVLHQAAMPGRVAGGQDIHQAAKSGGVEGIPKAVEGGLHISQRTAGLCHAHHLISPSASAPPVYPPLRCQRPLQKPACSCGLVINSVSAWVSSVGDPSFRCHGLSGNWCKTLESATCRCTY